MSSNPTPQGTQAPTAPRKPRWGRRLLIALMLLIVVLVALVALAPTIISTRPGTNWALGFAKGAIPGEIHINKLSVSWFSGQHIEGLRITHPDGHDVLNVASVDVPDATLFAVVKGQRDFGKITVSGAKVAAKQDAKGNIDLLEALSDPNKPKPASNEPTKIPDELRFDIELVDPQVTFSNPAIKDAKWSSQSVKVTMDGDALAVTAPTSAANVAAAPALASATSPDKAAAASVAITEPVAVKAPINIVRLPRKDGFFDLGGAQVDAELAIDQVVLQTAQGKATLRDTKGSVKYDPTAKELVVTLAGVTEREGNKGHIEVAINAANPLTASGGVDWAHLNAKVTAGLRAFPTPLLDVLQPTDNLATLGIGPTIDDLTLSATLTPTADGKSAAGPVSLVIKSQNVNGRIAGNVDASRKLTLDPDQELTIDVTRTLIDMLSKRFADKDGKSPFDQLQLEEKTPIKITIANLSTPLDATAASALVAKATLAVGPVGLKPEPDMLVNVKGLDLTVDYPASGKAGAQLVVKAEQGGKTATIDLALHTDRPSDPTKFDAMTARYDIEGQVTGLFVNLVDKLAKQDGLALDALGPTLGATISGYVKPGKEIKDYQAEVAVTPTSQRADGSAGLTGKIVAALRDGRITLTPESKATLALTPPLFDALIKRYMAPPAEGEKPLGIESTSNVTLSIAKLDAPLDGAQVKSTRMELRVDAEPVKLVGDKRLAGLTLRGLNVKIPETTLADPLIVLLDTTAEEGQLLIPINIQVAVKQAMETDRAIAAKVTIQKPPMATIGRFTDQTPLIAMLTGDIESAQVTYAKDPKEGDSKRISAKLASQGLAVDLSLKDTIDAAGRTLAIKGESPLVLTLTPARFAELIVYGKEPGTKPEYELMATTRLHVDLGDPVIALVVEKSDETAKPKAAGVTTSTTTTQAPATAAPGATSPAPTDAAATESKPLPVRVAQTRIALKVTGEPMKLRHINSGAELSVSNLTISLANGEQPASMHLLIDGVTKASAGSAVGGSAQSPPQEGPIHVDMTLANLADDKGLLSFSKMQVTSNESKVDGLPVALVDSLRPGASVEFAKLLGPTATAQFNGPILSDKAGDATLAVNAPYAVTSVQGRVENGALLLREDAVAQLTVTPYMTELLLEKINPIYKGATSDGPIKLTIDKKDFTWPMSNFELTKAQTKATLEVGSLDLTKGPVMDLIIKLLKRDTASLSRVEFTPMNFELKDGIVSYDNMKLKVDNIQLSFRGNVNLTNDQLNLRMGLSGDTLGRAFKEVRDFVKPNEFFEIPLTGTRSAPKLDTKALLGDIAKRAGPALLNKFLSGNKDDRELKPAPAPGSAPAPGNTPPSGDQPKNVNPSSTDDKPAEKKDPKKDAVNDVFNLLKKKLDKDKDKDKGKEPEKK